MPPFASEAQRKYLWATHPKIAKAWSHGRLSVTGKKEFTPKNKGLPKHKRKKRSLGDKYTGKYLLKGQLCQKRTGLSQQ